MSSSSSSSRSSLDADAAEFARRTRARHEREAELVRRIANGEAPPPAVAPPALPRVGGLPPLPPPRAQPRKYAGVVRDFRARKALQATTCYECEAFYRYMAETTGVPEEKLMRRYSRHRHEHLPPPDDQVNGWKVWPLGEDSPPRAPNKYNSAMVRFEEQRKAEAAAAAAAAKEEEEEEEEELPATDPPPAPELEEILPPTDPPVAEELDDRPVSPDILASQPLGTRCSQVEVQAKKDEAEAKLRAALQATPKDAGDIQELTMQVWMARWSVSSSSQ